MARYCRCGKPAVIMIKETGRWVCSLDPTECSWRRKALQKSAREMKKSNAELRT